MLSLSIGLNCGNVAASGSSPNTAALTTISGASKNSAITVSGSPALNGATNAGTSAQQMVRANQSASGKRWFEAKVTHLPPTGHGFFIGIDDGTGTFGPSTSTVPGENDNTGVTFFITPTTGWAICKGASFGGGGSGAANVSLNDVIRVEFDTTPGGASDTVSFFLNGTQVGPTITGLGTITTSAWAVFGVDTNEVDWTSNFGQNAPAFTPTAGFAGYGS